MLIVIARLGKDAETFTTPSNKGGIKFTAAYDIGWGDKKQTVWMDCVKWGDKVEGILPYLTKGASVQLICPEVYAHAYMANGEARATMRATVQDIRLLDKREAQPAQQQPARQAKPAPAAYDDFEDSQIPF